MEKLIGFIAPFTTKILIGVVLILLTTIALLTWQNSRLDNKVSKLTENNATLIAKNAEWQREFGVCTGLVEKQNKSIAIMGEAKKQAEIRAAAADKKAQAIGQARQSQKNTPAPINDGNKTCKDAMAIIDRDLKGSAL